jgi:hypothetical protein
MASSMVPMPPRMSRAETLRHMEVRRSGVRW